MAETPTPYEPAPPPMQPHRSGLVLTFGILSLTCCCFIFGIIAWILGNQDVRAMEAGTMDPSGQATTQTGRILGIIGTIWSVVVLILCVVYFAWIAHLVSTGKMPLPPTPR